MPYITSVEKLAKEEGIEKGMEKGMGKGMEKGIAKGMEAGRAEGQARGFAEGLALAIEIKFGSEARQVVADVYVLRDLAILRAVQDGLRNGASLDALRGLLR